jgi:predicted RNA binding protein YcfA (HicA-like mRNA interferase family)
MMRLVKELEKQGFNVIRAGSGHWKVTRPGRGGMVVLSFSPRGTPQHKVMKMLRELGYQE